MLDSCNEVAFLKDLKLRGTVQSTLLVEDYDIGTNLGGATFPFPVTSFLYYILMKIKGKTLFILIYYIIFLYFSAFCLQKQKVVSKE